MANSKCKVPNSAKIAAFEGAGFLLLDIQKVPFDFLILITQT